VSLVQKTDSRRNPGGNLKCMQKFGWEALKVGDTGVDGRTISECGL
jgi:hypothetical protein